MSSKEVMKLDLVDDDISDISSSKWLESEGVSGAGKLVSTDETNTMADKHIRLIRIENKKRTSKYQQISQDSGFVCIIVIWKFKYFFFFWG